MNRATRANMRTTEAAQESMAKALKISFYWICGRSFPCSNWNRWFSNYYAKFLKLTL